MRIFVEPFEVKIKHTLMDASLFSNQVLAQRENLRFFALSLTRNLPDSEDLVQETLCKAFTYRTRFTQNTNIKAWLFTIMKNIFINNYRRKTKARTIFDDSKDGYFINLPQLSRLPDPESSFRTKELLTAIDQLPEELGQPLKMYFEGYKYKEIAEKYGLPIGTVKSRIFMARRQIITILREPAQFKFIQESRVAAEEEACEEA